MIELNKWSPVLVLLTLLAAGDANAEHEADHRYSIRGYVLDASEQPLAGELVGATLAGQGTSSARTDDDGFYTINLHLHDGDIGRELVLRTGETTASIRMHAERGDQHSARIHWASFVGGEFREDALGRFQMPGWAWVVVGVGGLVVLLVAGARVQRLMKRRRRATETAGSATASTTKPKKRKKRRR